jgi:hypothetical protein
MAFPQTVLPISVRIAPGANPALAPSAWPSWVDISSDVRVESGIRIGDGRANEAANVDTASADLILDNRAGKYVPVNPNSPYYGLLKRNCPISIGTKIAVDNFTRSSSSGWGTPSAPTVNGVAWTCSGTGTDWTVTGTAGRLNIAANTARTATLTNGNAFNVAGTMTASVSALPTGGNFIVSARARYTDVNNYYHLQARFTPAGVIELNIVRNRLGTLVSVASVTLPLAFSAGTAIKFSWQVVGASIAMKAWLASGGEPAGWQLGYNDPLLLGGSLNDVLIWRTSTMTNVGTVTADVDDYSLEGIEFPGFVTEWPTRWNQDGGDSWAPIRASGVLRRLQQGSTPIKSPLYRQLSAQAFTSYWPLEDQVNTFSAANVATNGRPFYANGVTFGVVDPQLPAAKAVATFSTDTAKMYGYPAKGAGTTTGFSAMFLFKYGTLPGAATDAVVIGASGRISRWTIRMDATGIQLIGEDDSGAAVVTTAATLWVVNPLQWVAVQLETEVVGANTSWSLLWHAVGQATSTTFWSISSTYVSSVPSYVVGFTLKSSAAMNGTSWSSVWIGQNTLPFVDDTFSKVSSGYAGELASDRIKRVLAEELIPGYVEPGDSEPLGPQPIDAALPVARDAEAADYGTLFESGWGVGYRPRSQRYSRPVDLPLDRLSGHLALPPEPMYDDAKVVNDWTLSRTNGAQGANVNDPVHIAAEGKYDQGATINVATDDVLPSHAAWRVYLGTRPDLRWPSISLDLARNPSLITLWRSRPAWGGRLAVVNEPSQVIGSPPDVIMEGTEQILTPYGWDVDVNGSPARPWDMATLDDAAIRLDTAGCSIDATAHPSGITTATTAITVNTDTAQPYWRPWAPTSTMPGEVPFIVTCDGEDWTVTNVGNVFSTSRQVLTVTRSTNGIIKTHAAGADVRLKTPTYLAL